MKQYVEPKYFIGEFDEYESDGKDPHCVIGIQTEDNQGNFFELIDPEYQDWDWTEMIKWCVENFNGEYKIIMSDYGDFFIEVYDETDATAFKLRWI